MKLWTQDLVKKYKQRTVVKQVSVEVNQGEIVGLLGPNGAGKTTTFYMIVGLIKSNSGKVFLDDQEITAEPMYKRAQLGIGYLAQEASVFRQMTVVDNNGNFVKGNWSLVDKELNMKNIVELEPDFGKRFFHPTNNIKDAVGKYSFTYQTGNPNMPECGGHCYLVAEKGKLHWMMGQVTPNIAEGEGMASFVDSGFKGSYQNFSFEAYVDEYFVYVWRTNPDEGQVDDWGAWATLEGVYVRELEESGFDGSVN